MPQLCRHAPLHGFGADELREIDSSFLAETERPEAEASEHWLDGSRDSRQAPRAALG